VEILQSNVHQYAVSHYFDAATFAIYSVGCLQIPLVDFVANSVCNVMMVRMAEEMRDGHAQAAMAVWRETTRRLALVFAPVVGLLLVSAHPIITLLFTERYAASVPVFMVSSLAVLLATLQVDGVLRVYAQTRLLVALNGSSRRGISWGRSPSRCSRSPS
jgi:O-antigen/teichoic acid export membrane protein